MIRTSLLGLLLVSGWCAGGCFSVEPDRDAGMELDAQGGDPGPGDDGGIQDAGDREITDGGDQGADSGGDPGGDAGGDPGGDPGGDAGGDAVGDPGGDGDGFQRVRSCATRFTYVPDEPVSTVVLAGEWDWGQPEPMQFGDGVWSIEKELDPGLYCYKLIVDNQWILDPANPYQAYCDEVLNSGVRVEDCTRPLLTLDGEPARTADGLAARVLYFAGASGDGPAEFTATLLDDFTPEPTGAVWDPADWSLEVDVSGLAPGKYTLKIEAEDTSGQTAEPLLLPFWVDAAPFDWQDALIYMVLTDRFQNGAPANDPGPTDGAYAPADWRGGDLAGVTQLIESGYFDQLGVRALWLTPFNTNAAGTYPDAGSGHQVTGYHGYWPVAPREVDPRLGGAEDLRAMVAAAHDHGIRVLMDLVVNHVHEDHVYFQEHPGWFNDGCICGTPGCDWTEHRLTCLFASYMPDIDWTNREASEQFIADALWWLETFDLDGARIDAVKHVDDLCVFNLATRIRERFERAGADYYLDGETAMGWAGDNLEDNANEYGTINRYMGPWGLDGQFDFVLYHAVVNNVFVYASRGFVHLDVWTGHSQTQYLEGAVMTPYVGSHDTSRLVSRADYRGQDAEHPAEIAYHKWEEDGLPEEPGEEEPYLRARSAMCWLMTVPGAPMLYMGDEYGDFGGGDPDNRHMHRLEADLSAREGAMLAWVRNLGSVRQQVEALRRGGYRSLGSTETMLAFARELAGAAPAVVAINGGTSPDTIEVDLSALGFAAGFASEHLQLGGEMQVTATTGTVTLPPRSCAVFTPE